MKSKKEWRYRIRASRLVWISLRSTLTKGHADTVSIVLVLFEDSSIEDEACEAEDEAVVWDWGVFKSAGWRCCCLDIGKELKGRDTNKLGVEWIELDWIGFDSTRFYCIRCHWICTYRLLVRAPYMIKKKIQDYIISVWKNVFHEGFKQRKEKMKKKKREWEEEEEEKEIEETDQTKRLKPKVPKRKKKK